MQVHIVHVHPEPASFNGALTRTAQEVFAARGQSVTVSDLYAGGFDPVERAAHYWPRADPAVFSALDEQRFAWKAGKVPQDVRAEIDALERADLVLFQFPLWWHGPPAMLKGWMDRVFMNGGLYTSRRRYDAGHFRGRTAMLSVTSGAPAEAFGPGARGGDPDVMLWPLHYSLHYMGFRVLPAFWTFGIQGHGYAYEDEDAVSGRLVGQLARWRERLDAVSDLRPLDFPSWRDWDAGGRPSKARA